MGVVSRRWLWVESMGVVVKRYRFPHITFPTPLVSVLFCSSIPTSCSFKKMFFFLVLILFGN